MYIPRLSPQMQRVKDKHEKIMSSSITHLQPGDPEFDRIAKQCTPPSKIKTKHGMNRVFIDAPQSTKSRHSYTSTLVVQ